MPPLQERIESCKAFFERAKKRISRADEVISRFLEQKAFHEAKVTQASARLLGSHFDPEGPVVSAVEDLQKQIDQLVQERDTLRVGQSREEVQGKWMGNGPPLLDASLESARSRRLDERSELRPPPC